MAHCNRVRLTASALAWVGLLLVAAPTLWMSLLGLTQADAVLLAEAGSGGLALSRQLERTATTAGFAFLTAVFAIGIGLPTGIVLGSAPHSVGRALLSALLVLPVVVPTYITAWGWQRLFTAMGLGVLGTGSVIGAAFVLGTALFPLVMLPVAAQMAALDRESRDAAWQLGGARFAWRVAVLPALRPAWLGGGALVAIFALREWNVTALWNLDTLPHAVSAQFEATIGPTRFALAAAQSLPLGLLGALAVAVLLMVERRDSPPLNLDANSPLDSLSRGHYVVTSIMPMLVLIGVAGFTLGAPLLEGLGLIGAPNRVMAALVEPASLDALIASVETAAVAAAMAVVVFVPIGACASRGGTGVALWLLAWPVNVSALGMAALGVLQVVPRDALNGRLPLAVTHAVLFGPLVVRLVAQSVSRIPRDWLEAGATVGLGPWDRWWRLQWPYLRTPVANAAVLVFVCSLGDVAAAVLVAPPGQLLASPRLYNLLHYGREDSVAALCLWLAVLSSVAYGVVAAWGGGFKRI